MRTGALATGPKGQGRAPWQDLCTWRDRPLRECGRARLVEMQRQASTSDWLSPSWKSEVREPGRPSQKGMEKAQGQTEIASHYPQIAVTR